MMLLTKKNFLNEEKILIHFGQFIKEVEKKNL